jgi:hypothetical protein
MRVRKDVRIISAQGIISSPVSFHVIDDVIPLLIRHTRGADGKSQCCKTFKNIPESHCIPKYSFYTWNTRTLTCFDTFCGSSSGSVDQYLYKGKSKVKVTLVEALRLCTGRKAHRGSGGIAVIFHDHGIEGGEGSGSCPGLLFTYLLHGAESFLRSQPVNFSAFMEPESPSHYPQVPATCPYPEPAPSSPHDPLQFPEDPS